MSGALLEDGDNEAGLVSKRSKELGVCSRGNLKRDLLIFLTRYFFFPPKVFFFFFS